jgi:hypothetical protein
MSTEPVAFSLQATPYHPPPKDAKCCASLPENKDEVHEIQYRVPRNYIVWMDNWAGGPQTLVRFKVTFPGFEPLTQTTLPCITLAPADHPQDCAPLEFSIRRGGGSSDPPDDQQFNNMRSAFHSQTPRSGPNGFEIFETGPADARINTYRKKTAEHTLIITCFMRPPGDSHAPTCNNESRLATGNVLQYHIYGDQLKDASEIDTGLRRLAERGFHTKGE